MLVETEEIYLKDYFRILAENKLLIGVIFFITLVAGAVFSFFSSQTYEVDVWLEIGKAKNVLVEEPIHVVRKIREGIYGEFKDGEIEAIVANKTNLIQVKIKTENPENASEFLNNLGNHIVSEHNKIINKERIFIEERLIKDKKEIELWKDIKKRAGINQADSVYQMIALFAESNLEGRENDIKAFELSFNGVSDSKIIKAPNVILPSQTKKFALNFVIFGFSGLFLGVFMAFWRKVF